MWSLLMPAHLVTSWRLLGVRAAALGYRLLVFLFITAVPLLRRHAGPEASDLVAWTQCTQAATPGRWRYIVRCVCWLPTY